jgi:hypothetical protein
MASKRANTSIVNLADGRTVLYSYGVAVAAHIPTLCTEGTPFVALDHSFSVTTSKHVNHFTDRRAVRLPPARFAELIAPLAPTYPDGVL